MTAATWVTLIVAILGALHGPGTQAVLQKWANRKATK
jgi:hypothetical protein